jgi:hypothetical protein
MSHTDTPTTTGTESKPRERKLGRFELPWIQETTTTQSGPLVKTAVSMSHGLILVVEDPFDSDWAPDVPPGMTKPAYIRVSQRPVQGDVMPLADWLRESAEARSLLAVPGEFQVIMEITDWTELQAIVWAPGGRSFEHARAFAEGLHDLYAIAMENRGLHVWRSNLVWAKGSSVAR